MHSEEITQLTVFGNGLIAVVDGKVSTDPEIINCLGGPLFCDCWVHACTKAGTPRNCVVTVVRSHSHIAYCTVWMLPFNAMWVFCKEGTAYQ